MSLIDSDDVNRWADAAGSYESTLHSLFHIKNASVIELDAFISSALPIAIAARSPPHMLKEEYCRLVQWKLRKGKFRPNLEKFANELASDAVEAATTSAFADVARGGEAGLRAALKSLMTLKGNGPATATAVLATYDTSVPFMSDEALSAAFPGRPIVYKLEEALALTQRLREVANILNDRMHALMADASVDAHRRDAVCAAISSCPGGPHTPLWTAQRVQNALWSNARAGTAPAAAPRVKPAAAAPAPRSRLAAVPPQPAIDSAAAAPTAIATGAAAHAGVKRSYESASIAARRGRYAPAIIAPPPVSGSHDFAAAALVASPDPVVMGSSQKKRRAAPGALDTSQAPVMLHTTTDVLQSLMSPPCMPSMVSPALGATAPRLL